MPGVPDVIKVRRYFHDLLSSCVPLFAGLERSVLQDLQLLLPNPKKVCTGEAPSSFSPALPCLGL